MKAYIIEFVVNFDEAPPLRMTITLQQLMHMINSLTWLQMNPGAGETLTIVISERHGCRVTLANSDEEGMTNLFYERDGEGDPILVDTNQLNENLLFMYNDVSPENAPHMTRQEYDEYLESIGFVRMQ